MSIHYSKLMFTRHQHVILLNNYQHTIITATVKNDLLAPHAQHRYAELYRVTRGLDLQYYSTSNLKHAIIDFIENSKKAY